MRTCQKMFLMLLLLGYPVFAAQPQEIQLTKILEIGGPIEFLSLGTLNDRGTVAVTVIIEGIKYAVLVGDGRTLSRVAETTVGSFGPAAINNRGDVVFRASFLEGRRILLSRNGKIFTLVDEDEPFAVSGEPVINGRGTVAFTALLGDGHRAVLALDHREFTTIATSRLGIITYDINQRGQVLSLADPSRPSAATLIVSDGRTTWIPADASGEFEIFTGGAINERGTVAFSVFLGDLGQRVYLADPRSGLRLVATSDGAFNTMWLAGLTNSGTPVFNASLDTGGSGVFFGPDPVADKVIATGDILNGATVTFVTASDVNASGQVLLWIGLDNGIAALYRTQPGGVR